MSNPINDSLRVSEQIPRGDNETRTALEALLLRLTDGLKIPEEVAKKAIGM